MEKNITITKEEMLEKAKKAEIKTDEYKEKNTKWFQAFINVLSVSDDDTSLELIYVDRPYNGLLYVNDGNYSGVIPVDVFNSCTGVSDAFSEASDIIYNFFLEYGTYMSEDEFCYPQNPSSDEIDVDPLIQEDTAITVVSNCMKEASAKGMKIADDVINTISSFVYNNFYLDSHKLRIKVVTDANELADDAAIIEDKMEHSWAGATNKTSSISVLYGNFQPREYYSDCYYDNGNLTYNSTSSKEAEFDVKSTIVAYKEENSFSNYDHDDYNQYKYTLYIYIGGNYQSSSDKQEMIDKYIK